MPRYSPAEIEPKWQAFWESQRTFATPRLPQGPKLYVLDMFPYPSGEGLHVGHPEGYTATDITARWQRMLGRTVMHPMGWGRVRLAGRTVRQENRHAPAGHDQEKHQHLSQPAQDARLQLRLGARAGDHRRGLLPLDPVDLSATLRHVVRRCRCSAADRSPNCRFRRMSRPPASDVVRRFQDEHRLAYQSSAPVNWCPALGTVLANEEVIGGVSERGGHPVVRIPLRQWMLRITAYADRLERDLEGLDWSESVKALQRNWIGRSDGAEVDFFIGDEAKVSDATGRKTAGSAASAFAAWETSRAKSGFPRNAGADVIRVYTTRPDTLFGATYMVIAPEHPLVDRLTIPAAESKRFRRIAPRRRGRAIWTELISPNTRQASSQAPSPSTRPMASRRRFGSPTMCWPVMAPGRSWPCRRTTPATFEFAQQFKIPIQPVVDPGARYRGRYREPSVLAGEALVLPGMARSIHSHQYNGLSTAECKVRIVVDLSTAGVARAAVNYKLRDWLFSRQHFWGEPFPLLHELGADGVLTGVVRPVPVEQLPVDLPELAKYEDHGSPDPPLEQAPADWLYVTLDGKRYKRETNSMPQWAGSCWYYLRFLDPQNGQTLVDPEIERAWMPVDLYIGGAEHAVLHLLYARFWHKVLYDRGLVSTLEPFHKLVNQGMILGELEITGYQRADGSWVNPSETEAAGPNPSRRGHGRRKTW